MNANKKADLQRRLTLASVPKPPEGLAERIKREIPDHFAAGQKEDRNRLASSIAFNMRVAASILLLISSVYVGFRLLSPGYDLQKQAAAPALVPPATRHQTEELARANTGTMSTLTAPAAAPQQYARLDTEHDTPADARPTDEGPMLTRTGDQITAIASAPAVGPANASTFSGAVPPPAAVPPPVVVATAEAPASTTEIAKIARERSADAVEAAPVVEPDRREAARAEKTESAPVPTAAGRAAAATAPKPEGLSFDFVRPAQANELSLGERSEVFGVSTDRAAFARVKSTIERGERPTAKSVNVEAIVNYFASAASRPPHGIRLEVEASPALGASGRAYLLRYTIDTPQADVGPGGSVPPAASDATVAIEFEPSVTSWHHVGGEATSKASEATLLDNVSVTTLYEVQLQPNANPRTPVATVRLRYRDVQSGREQTINRTIRLSDISRSWAAASRRHRLASLGAVWSESLRGSANTIDVARRAEELANQNPHDAKARELADVANALRELSGTGSGR
jgi:hypothetical protein